MAAEFVAEEPGRLLAFAALLSSGAAFRSGSSNGADDMRIALESSATYGVPAETCVRLIIVPLQCCCQAALPFTRGYSEGAVLRFALEKPAPPAKYRQSDVADQLRLRSPAA